MISMKIGIITFHRAENYGSVFYRLMHLIFYIRMIIPDAEVEEVDYESEAQHKLYRIFTMPKSILGFARFSTYFV